MRVPSFIMPMFNRGRRRRQAIMQLLAAEPERRFLEADICMALRTWIGVIHPDMLMLKDSGHVTQYIDEHSRAWYQYKRTGPFEEVSE